MSYDYLHMFDFRGGLNLSASPDNLSANELLDAKNIDLSNRGGFSRRKGISEFHNLGVDKRVDRLVEFEVLIDGETVLQKLVLYDGSLVNITTSLVVATGLGKHMDYAIFKNKMYILSNNKYLVYDGKVAATDVTCTEADSNLAAVKKCRYITKRGERFFAAGNREDPNALYFTEPGRPEYFKVLNIIQALTEDGDKITGLKEFHGSVLVFKARTIYAWFGYDPKSDVAFQRLSVHTGTRYFRTIVNVDKYLFFLGEDGVYALFGTTKDVISTVKLSKNITPLIDKIKHDNTTSAIDVFTAPPCAVYHEGKYMLSVPTGDNPLVNDTVLVFFNELFQPPEVEPWTVYTGWNVSEFLRSMDGNLYSASSVTGRLHIHDNVYSDLGAGISIRVELRPIHAEAPIHNKKFRYCYMALRQYEEYESHANVDYKVDYIERLAALTGSESLVWDDRSWDNYVWDFTDLVTRRVAIRLKGKRLRLTVHDSSVDEALVVYGFGIEYKLKKPDRG